MKLTKEIRAAFVRAAMQDVPWTKDHRSEIEAKIRDIFVAKLPPLIARAWKDNAVRGYVSVARFYGYGVKVTVPYTSDSQHLYEGQLEQNDQDALDVLSKAWRAEEADRERLEEQLRALVAGCSTRKALVDQLPEFEKYLPAEHSAAKTLPAVANVVADFVKAGWPASATERKETK